MNLQDIGCRYKQIIGFEDYYITEEGDVYSTRPIGVGKTHKLHKLKPKEPGRPDKYFNVVLCRDDGQYTRLIHRLVAEYFVEGYFEGAVVNHIDGNNRNNHYSNLEWTTTEDNIHKSYITSGKGAKRSYRLWILYDPDEHVVGMFESHIEMEQYVIDIGLDTSPTMLTRNGESRGYSVIKEEPIMCR